MVARTRATDAMRLAPTLTASLLAGATFLVAGRAQAAPPSGESFDIRYYTTDENADRSRQFTPFDLQGFVNKARCECGQNISTRIRISNDATDLDTVQIRTFVGNNCDIAQGGFMPMYKKCPIAFDAFTNAYTRNVDITFNPLWLATGISNESPQNIDDAIANGSCEHGQGNGGIWICAENGMNTDCQADEFVVTGTQNLNAGAEEQMGIRFDFDPPIVTVTDFKLAGGDGAVEVSWKNTSSGAIDGGFRVLCADANGQPVPGKGFKQDSVTAKVYGNIYFTKDNLCPDGPFDQVEIDPDPIPPTTGGETGTGTGGDSTGGGTDDSGGGTTFGAAFGDEPNPQHGGTSNCCAVKMGGGCDNVGCESIVCDGDNDPCCTTEWTQACANEAAMKCLTCGGAGDCCSTNASPSCYDQSCMDIVCVDSPGCCDSVWDGACAAAAQASCPVCMDDTTTGDTAGSSDSGSTAAATDTDTDTDGTASGTDTDGISSPIESLDWAYVCSGFIAPAASTARITGLQNDVEYQVLVVAYDRSGNPIPVSDVLTAIPRETTDLWEQCQIQGGICGEGGFCNCRATERSPDEDAAWLLVLTLFGLRRRRAAA